MSPLTPAKYYDGRLAVQLPPKLMPAFLYLSEISLTRPEIAAFPTYFLAAISGNHDAQRKVLEMVYIAHSAGTRYAVTQDDRAIANAIVFLGNSLAAMWERGELNHDGTKQPPPETSPAKQIQKPAPVKQVAKKQNAKPKPATDRQIRFTKPGTMSRQESK